MAHREGAGSSDGIELGPVSPGPNKSWVRRRWSALGTLGRIFLTSAVSILAALLVTSFYSEWIKPHLDRSDVPRVEILQPDNFTIRGLAHSGAWVFPSGTPSPDAAPPGVVGPENSTALNAWAIQSGAVAAQTLALRLTVRAPDETPIILHGLRVNVVSREPPIDGWMFYPSIGCGGQPVRIVTFNLDEDPVVPMELDSGESKPFDVTLRVTETDPEVYEIHAVSLSHYVEFTLTLLYDNESGPGELQIGEQPFRVTGIPPAVDAWVNPISPDEEPTLVRDASRDGSSLGC